MCPCLLLLFCAAVVVFCFRFCLIFSFFLGLLNILRGCPWSAFGPACWVLASFFRRYVKNWSGFSPVCEKSVGLFWGPRPGLKKICGFFWFLGWPLGCPFWVCFGCSEKGYLVRWARFWPGPVSGRGKTAWVFRGPGGRRLKLWPFFWAPGLESGSAFLAARVEIGSFFVDFLKISAIFFRFFEKSGRFPRVSAKNGPGIGLAGGLAGLLAGGAWPGRGLAAAAGVAWLPWAWWCVCFAFLGVIPMVWCAARWCVAIF